MSDTERPLAAHQHDGDAHSAQTDYRLLAEFAPVGIFQTDANGQCQFVNRRWCELAGMTPEAARGRGWIEAVHPEDRDRVLREWDAAAQAGREFQSEYRFRTADGQTTWLNGRASALHDGEGRVTAFVGVVTDVSERKAIEESLLAKEAQLRLVTDHAAVYIAHCGKDLRFKFVNRSYAARLGLTPEQCVGRTIPELLGRNAYDSFRHYVDRVLRGDTFDYEVEIPYQRMGRRIMHCAYVPERDPSGQVIGWIAALTDVTDRRLAEEALQSSEQRFTRFMQHLPGLAWIKDAEGRYLYGNDAALEAFNVTREQFYGHTDADIFPPETARQFQEHDRRALSSDAGAVQLIETLVHPDGEVHHSLVSKFSLPDIDGKSMLIAGVAFDVTDRLNAEAALRENTVRLELAQQAGRIGTFEWNLQTGSVTWSAIEEELYGFAKGAFGGRFEDWQAALHPDDRWRAVEACEIAAANRSQLDTEFRIIRPDGEIRWITAHARIHFDDSGMPLRMVGVNVDVTDWRNNEAALREADHRKDEFLATLAHELRNPLAPIRNALHVITLSGDDRSLLADAREMMERQVNQMVHLIDDLLDVSRITRNKLELRKSPIELAAAIQSAVEATKPAIDSMGHRLEVDLPGEPIVLDADLTRLAQVISNLLANAAKFTEPGGQIRLAVTLGPSDVLLTVRDNGIGISADELPRIFEMFSQVDRSLERNRGGLGIGLTLVKRLVELHHGTVAAYSDGPGHGSEFRIRLPRFVATPSARPLPSVSGTPQTFASLRILVADDNPDSAHSLALLLRVKGAEVRTAHDGLEACSAAEEFQPHVIVMDLGMPRLNGYDAASRIRAQPWGRAMTLVALSGWGQAADQQRSLAAGFNHHLVKPGDLTVLERLLADRSA